MSIRTVIRPGSLDEALKELSGKNQGTALIAGGTDLLPAMAKGVMTPETLIDLEGIAELKELKKVGSDIHIGAALTHNELLTSFIGEELGAFHDSFIDIACNQTRNMGTIGGNIVMAVPSADTAPPLLVYDAEVVLISAARGERRIQLFEFFRGPRKTVLETDEILVKFILPDAEGRLSAFIKHGRRKALSLAVVNVAVSLRLVDGLCRDVRIAMGAVAPTPVRAYRSEAILEGKAPTAENILAAAEKASVDECSPIDDFRSSCAYRQELVKVYVRRALEKITQ